MHPKNLSIRDFTYELPEQYIAKFPLARRDASKLLIYYNGRITEDVYRNLVAYLPENSLLIFNNTRVIEARILFKKITGGSIEIFCLEPHDIYPDITSAMLQKGKVWWRCLIGGASKWKAGQVLEKKLTIDGRQVVLLAKYMEKKEDNFLIEFSWQPDVFSFAEVLHLAGIIPLPPYLKREVIDADNERYQTIYASEHGSVAAPTAGLHFTEQVFSSLAAAHLDHDFITLHVGAGTFQPVKSEKLEEHLMHEEFIEVPRTTIEKLIRHLPGDIIAVGTTSMRTLESLFWMGLKTTIHPDIAVSSLRVNQWDAYETETQGVSAADALDSLLNWMKKNELKSIFTKTQLLIAPGYQFKICRALITNFHQPQSSLLLLVAALIGIEWKNVYSYAMQNDFRFLSYGDGCLLFRAAP